MDDPLLVDHSVDLVLVKHQKQARRGTGNPSVSVGLGAKQRLMFGSV